MTIQGAMNELVNLLNADDIPVYYKGGIKKVIETIDDYIDGRDDYVKRKTEPQTCEECEHWNDTEDGCADRHGCKTEPTISKMEQVDEPQTNKDFKVTYTCSFTDCKNFGFNEKCIECKRKQSEARLEDEPQTDCPWK